MNTALSQTLTPSSQSGLRPCQRSCRGLMMYIPPRPPREGTAAKDSDTSTWRNTEPICFGLSTTLSGPILDLTKLHEARQIPPEQYVDFSVVLGHAVYQTSSTTHVVPPGCMTGVEFLRFHKTPGDTIASSDASGSFVGMTSASQAPESATEELRDLLKELRSSVVSYVSSFRLLTSSADTNARISQTWASIVGFNPVQYADKLQAQASKNWNSMSKWVREVSDAVTQPPKE